LKYYIGLLSGTSIDGIDAAIVGFGKNKIKLIETHSKVFSHELSQQLLNIINSQSTTLTDMANIDYQLAYEFSNAVLELLVKAKMDAREIKAIGSHGQTVYHQPNEDDDKLKKNTIQLGSSHIIAAMTQIDVVSNFRNLDMAYAGQGAPLAPIIHQKLYAKKNDNIAVLNLGGIANISFIGKDYKKIIGFDTGPANCLLDEWICFHKQCKYDNNGDWARAGGLNKILLDQMLNDSYFLKNHPKSTGREYFNRKWFDKFKDQFKITSAVDIQCTLTHLTAQSIARTLYKNISTLIVTGGGAHNCYLLELIQKYSQVKLIIAKNPDWIEAMLFAYLAHRRIKNKRFNLSSITGSYKKILLGDITKY